MRSPLDPVRQCGNERRTRSAVCLRNRPSRSSTYISRLSAHTSKQSDQRHPEIIAITMLFLPLFLSCVVAIAMPANPAPGSAETVVDRAVQQDDILPPTRTYESEGQQQRVPSIDEIDAFFTSRYKEAATGELKAFSTGRNGVPFIPNEDGQYGD
jgi:hypothetical protein